MPCGCSAATNPLDGGRSHKFALVEFLVAGSSPKNRGPNEDANGEGGIRTHGTANRTPVFETGFETIGQLTQRGSNKAVSDNQEDGATKRLALCLAHSVEKYPDLAKLIDAWPTLPEPVKAGIRAMVEAARSG